MCRKPRWARLKKKKKRTANRCVGLTSSNARLPITLLFPNMIMYVAQRPNNSSVVGWRTTKCFEYPGRSSSALNVPASSGHLRPKQSCQRSADAYRSLRFSQTSTNHCLIKTHRLSMHLSIKKNSLKVSQQMNVPLLPERRRAWNLDRENTRCVSFAEYHRRCRFEGC